MGPNMFSMIDSVCAYRVCGMRVSRLHADARSKTKYRKSKRAVYTHRKSHCTYVQCLLSSPPPTPTPLLPTGVRTRPLAQDVSMDWRRSPACPAHSCTVKLTSTTRTNMIHAHVHVQSHVLSSCPCPHIHSMSTSMSMLHADGCVCCYLMSSCLMPSCGSGPISAK